MTVLVQTQLDMHPYSRVHVVFSDPWNSHDLADSLMKSRPADRAKP